AATSDSGCALDLDAAGRVVGPFAQTADAGEPVPGTAERAAFARLAAGTEDEALAFFAHAAESALSPEGWLAFARLRGERDPDLGAATLADARARFATVRCGPVPCPLLAAIVESRWPPDLAASRDDELLAALRDVPAGAVATVASALAAVRPALRDDPRLDALRAAAAAFDALHGTAAPRASRPGPHGTVLVAAGEGAVHVLAAAAVRAACDVVCAPGAATCECTARNDRRPRARRGARRLPARQPRGRLARAPPGRAHPHAVGVRRRGVARAAHAARGAVAQGRDAGARRRTAGTRRALPARPARRLPAPRPAGAARARLRAPGARRPPASRHRPGAVAARAQRARRPAGPAPRAPAGRGRRAARPAGGARRPHGAHP